MTLRCPRRLLEAGPKHKSLFHAPPGHGLSIGNLTPGSLSFCLGAVPWACLEREIPGFPPLEPRKNNIYK